jgi:hypothetical protein
MQDSALRKIIKIHFELHTVDAWEEDEIFSDLFTSLTEAGTRF